MRVLNIINIAETMILFKALAFFNTWSSQRFPLMEELNVNEKQLEKFKRAFH